MVFTHDKNADQLSPLSYGNLRGLEANSHLASFTETNSGDASPNSNFTGLGNENMFSNAEESKFGNVALKDSFPVSAQDYSFFWLPGSSCQSSTVDHGKRSPSDVKPCQVACKRPRQTEQSTWLYSYEERPVSIAVEASISALADEVFKTGEPDHIHSNNSITTCGTSSCIPYPNCEEPMGEESLYLPDWMTSFPGYFEDCGPATEYNQVNDIDSPVHEYLPRKGVAIGPNHQADIPEWRAHISMDVPGGSGLCANLAHTSVSTLESVPRDEDSESDKWIRDCVIPMSSCSYPVDSVGDHRIDCECSDEGSIRCVRQHVIEARESVRKSLGRDKFRDLGLSEMGEDVAERWTYEDQQLFRRVVISNPVSLGKSFWDYLPLALPGKTSKDLVSYYFNIFMLRRRAHQNRSDLMHVDSDDDDSPTEHASTEQEDEDSAVESPPHGHVGSFVSTEDVHEESEGEQFNGSSFPEQIIKNVPESRCSPVQTILVQDEDIQDGMDDSCTSFDGQHNGAHGPNVVQCAEFHMLLPRDTPKNCGDQGGCV